MVGLLVLLMDSQTPKASFLKGPASLIIAVVVVVALLIFLPGYRLFFAISVGIGIVFAGGIYLWHKLNPITDKDVPPDDKHPLGLS
jgi:divalent metal cation (Fe/Co/Zn/Cd) transporter